MKQVDPLLSFEALYGGNFAGELDGQPRQIAETVHADRQSRFHGAKWLRDLAPASVKIAFAHMEYLRMGLGQAAIAKLRKGGPQEFDYVLVFPAVRVPYNGVNPARLVAMTLHNAEYQLQVPGEAFRLALEQQEPLSFERLAALYESA